MRATNLALRIQTDEDYLRLVSYRAVLREIAKDAEPWDGAGQIAREVLEHFGEAEG